MSAPSSFRIKRLAAGLICIAQGRASSSPPLRITSGYEMGRASGIPWQQVILSLLKTDDGARRRSPEHREAPAGQGTRGIGPRGTVLFAGNHVPGSRGGLEAIDIVSPLIPLFSGASSRYPMHLLHTPPASSTGCPAWSGGSDRSSSCRVSPRSGTARPCTIPQSPR